jgi:hypothetical protein
MNQYKDIFLAYVRRGDTGAMVDLMPIIQYSLGSEKFWALALGSACDIDTIECIFDYMPQTPRTQICCDALCILCERTDTARLALFKYIRNLLPRAYMPFNSCVLDSVCKYGCVDICLYLMEFDMYYKSISTVLCEDAARYGHYELFNLLLFHLKRRDPRPVFMALYRAAYMGGNQQIIDMLPDLNHADVNHHYEAVFGACVGGHAHLVEQLIQDHPGYIPDVFVIGGMHRLGAAAAPIWDIYLDRGGTTVTFYMLLWAHEYNYTRLTDNYTIAHMISMSYGIARNHIIWHGGNREFKKRLIAELNYTAHGPAIYACVEYAYVHDLELFQACIAHHGGVLQLIRYAGIVFAAPDHCNIHILKYILDNDIVPLELITRDLVRNMIWLLDLGVVPERFATHSLLYERAMRYNAHYNTYVAAIHDALSHMPSVLSRIVVTYVDRTQYMYDHAGQ